MLEQANKFLYEYVHGAGFPETRRMVDLVLRNEARNPKGKWSTQGLGMLRLYLDPEQKFRLHIWDKRLVVADASPLHDHPWHFTSLVVAGNVKQFRFKHWTYGENRERYNCATIKCGEGAHCTSETKVVTLSRQPFELYKESQTYSQAKSEIHESLADHGSVTLVERTFVGQRDAAHVYWGGNGPFGTAEPRPATSAEIRAACEYALATWF